MICCLVDIILISSKHKAEEHLVKHAKVLISQADYYPKDGDQLGVYSTAMTIKTLSFKPQFLMRRKMGTKSHILIRHLNVGIYFILRNVCIDNHPNTYSCRRPTRND